MAFTLNKIVPWGRSFNEYRAMFALTETDLGKRILGCADGPASFNCILTKRGLYSEQLSEEYHLGSLRELCRVAAEARVFPLLDLGGVKSRHVDMTVSRLRSEGYYAVIENVAYEFQRGGNQMVRIYAT